MIPDPERVTELIRGHIDRLVAGAELRDEPPTPATSRRPTRSKA